MGSLREEAKDLVNEARLIVDVNRPEIWQSLYIRNNKKKKEKK